MDVRLSAREKLQRAEDRLLWLKSERPLLYREFAIDVAISVVRGLKQDIVRGLITAEEDLLSIVQFAEQVLWSFMFLQPEGPAPYASNLEHLTSVLKQYRPQFEKFR